MLALSEQDFVSTDGRAFVIFMAGSQGTADEPCCTSPAPACEA
jgi:hypothetical protein